MSENPYIDGGGYLDDGPVAGSRTSVLAVASLTTGLLCCVPFLGVLSIVLGASSMLLIGRSNGRLTGKTAAIAGLIVGIMTTVIWGAIGAGGLQTWTFYTKQMVPIGDSAMQAAETGDVPALRGLLNSKADGDLTDDQIRTFLTACSEQMGTIQGASSNFGTLFESFGETYKRSRGGNSGGGSQFTENVAPVPMSIEASNGLYIIWCLFDESTLGGGGQPKLADLLVMRTGMDGFTLRENGSGREMGYAMSLHVSTASEALEAMEAEKAKQSAPAAPDGNGVPEAPGG